MFLKCLGCVSKLVSVLGVLLSSFILTSSVVGLHHVAAFFPCFLDRLSINLMAVSTEHAPKGKQPGYLSYAVYL